MTHRHDVIYKRCNKKEKLLSSILKILELRVDKILKTLSFFLSVRYCICYNVLSYVGYKTGLGADFLFPSIRTEICLHFEFVCCKDSTAFVETKESPCNTTFHSITAKFYGFETKPCRKYNAIHV